MDNRELCEHLGKTALECFENYVSGEWTGALFLMTSEWGESERERIFRLIEEYRKKIRDEPDENTRWHMYEEFRALS